MSEMPSSSETALPMENPPLPDFLERYQPPVEATEGEGALAPTINEHDFQRYEHCKNLYQEVIRQAAVRDQPYAYLKAIQTRQEQGEAAEVVRLIVDGLRSNIPRTMRNCVEALYILDDAQREEVFRQAPEIIEETLQQGNQEAQQVILGLVPGLPVGERKRFLCQAVVLPNPDLQIACLGWVYLLGLPEEDVLEVLELGLQAEVPQVQAQAAKSISLLREETNRSKLYAFVRSQLDQALASQDVQLQKVWVPLISSLPFEDSREPIFQLRELILQGLKSTDPVTQRAYAQMIDNLPQADREVFFEVAKTQVGNVLVEPPLYDSAGLGEGNISRAEFVKTGSGLTLLGGPLRNRVIMRHVAPRAFYIWQGLFEAHDVWQEEGFDYVPIEPIASFRPNKEGGVDVAAGVLDVSLAAWEQMGGPFLQELDRDKSRIQKVLQWFRVQHGHLHDNNFCLRFWRNSQGEVDFDRKPRLYLIDFDQATNRPTAA